MLLSLPFNSSYEVRKLKSENIKNKETQSLVGLPPGELLINTEMFFMAKSFKIKSLKIRQFIKSIQTKAHSKMS